MRDANKTLTQRALIMELLKLGPGLPLFFMVLAIVFGVALMAQGGWRMLHGLPVVCDR